jgi:hypothetical protein
VPNKRHSQNGKMIPNLITCEKQWDLFLGKHLFLSLKCDHCCYPRVNSRFPVCVVAETLLAPTRKKREVRPKVGHYEFLVDSERAWLGNPHISNAIKILEMNIEFNTWPPLFLIDNIKSLTFLKFRRFKSKSWWL